ncbi:MAG TPA: indolepyruvate ferredoxin oxidoreductase family protein [Methylomirabilota bacterium]|jgi:indolepyruvate ferredoxin oxidoreductase|nr:indolepyruvate ferredoxin oxidoreductase family protein [Methylomirabilota bacterium]
MDTATPLPSASADADLALDDRYLREEGEVHLSGMQALVRLPIDQSRRDRRARLRIGTFISGYPGSPLGGYDLTLRQARKILEQHDIRHVPGANEELAATALSGTQMLDRYPHSRYDGVVGLWYGKGPGVDRSGDALKHGNFAGTSRHGAVVVLAGDDHEAKSSTMPYQDDYAFVGHGIPVLYPASTAEFLTLGLHAIALSRFSGCWVAMKLVGQLADGGETVHVSPDDPGIIVPQLLIDGKPFRKSTDFTFFPGLNIETERQLYYERHRAVLAYARANSLTRAELGAAADRVGLVTAGKSYADLRQALSDLGLDEGALRRLGVRLLKVGLTYPLDADAVRAFARELEQIVVVEEKRGFLEGQVKEALAGFRQGVRVLGKADETGAPLFPIQGGMDSDAVAERLGPRLLRLAEGQPDVAASIRRRLDAIGAVRARPYEVHPGRTPNYCSGCPHNVGTRLLPGELAWGSPGCHSFASIIEQPERHIVSMTQLGGEGLPWIGLQPYTDRPHMVQNVGDGSLFHSSFLNIRFCVAAGADITFKILYNGFVANTGAQEMVGGKPVPELTRMLELEGVRATVVLTKDPDAYRGADLAGNARVETVERQEIVLRELAATPGVTVLIHDGLCANERRRRQKRGQLPAPSRFVVINEEACEGCGHCGALTNCMSLHRVETELGPKTRIHTSSCNQDLSCLGGDCPSFVTVETAPGTGYRKPSPPVLAAAAVPEPSRRAGIEQPYHVYLPGVGGTGVITMNALLSWAALIDGLHVLSYDQTGAAQKWGPVLSSLILAAPGQVAAANKVGLGRADLYLALDLLAAGTRVNLDRCDPARTVAVVNSSVLPSGEMVRNVDFTPPVTAIRAQIDRWTRADANVTIDARRLAEGLFGDYMTTNMLVLGVAYQAGLLPLTGAAIEEAVRLNGVAVEQNLQAFRYGRLWQADPDRVRVLVEPPARSFETERAVTLERLGGRDASAYVSLLDRCAALDPEARRLLAVRVGELIDYADARYAAAFVDFVLEVAGREEVLAPGRREVTHAVIRNLYKLMAYKDEYEVARLHLKPVFHAGTRQLFSAPRRLFWHLHPPLLRALGLRRKLRLGPWFRHALRAIRALRRLRGTPFDPFGYAAVRREERHLVPWYRALVRDALGAADADGHATAVELARLPEAIRGYEDIKLRSIATARARAEALVGAKA